MRNRILVLGLLLMSTAFAVHKSKIWVSKVAADATFGPRFAVGLQSEIESRLVEHPLVDLLDHSQVASSIADIGDCDSPGCFYPLAHQLKVSILLTVQARPVGAGRIRISSQVYSVEKGAVESKDWIVPEGTGLGNVVTEICRFATEGLALEGRIVNRDPDRVDVNLGTKDRIEEGQESLVVRYEASAGSPAGYARRVIGMGRLVGLHDTSSRLVILERNSNVIFDSLRPGDRIEIVTNENTHRRHAMGYFKDAQYAYENESFSQAMSAIRMSLQRFPQDSDFLAMQRKIQAKIDAEERKAAAESAREQRQYEAEERRRKASEGDGDDEYPFTGFHLGASMRSIHYSTSVSYNYRGTTYNGNSSYQTANIWGIELGGIGKIVGNEYFGLLTYGGLDGSFMVHSPFTQMALEPYFGFGLGMKFGGFIMTVGCHGSVPVMRGLGGTDLLNLDSYSYGSSSSSFSTSGIVKIGLGGGFWSEIAFKFAKHFGLYVRYRGNTFIALSTGDTLTDNTLGFGLVF